MTQRLLSTYDCCLNDHICPSFKGTKTVLFLFHDGNYMFVCNVYLNEFLTVFQCHSSDKPEQQPEWLKDLDHEDISVLQGKLLDLKLF